MVDYGVNACLGRVEGLDEICIFETNDGFGLPSFGIFFLERVFRTVLGISAFSKLAFKSDRRHHVLRDGDFLRGVVLS